MVKAVAILKGTAGVSGITYFEQESEDKPTTISWDIRGNTANSKRGFHIHEFGDVTNGCTSAGPHFNPFLKQHGHPDDENRHVGDLGNIECDENGESKGQKVDNQIKLTGKNSIIGRSIVVHFAEDDYGRGGGRESLETGNAGPRAACGIIGMTE